MASGEPGQSGPTVASPAILGLDQDLGNVMHQLLLMEAKNVKELMRKQRSVTANPVQVLDYNR